VCDEVGLGCGGVCGEGCLGCQSFWCGSVLDVVVVVCMCLVIRGVREWAFTSMQLAACKRMTMQPAVSATQYTRAAEAPSMQQQPPTRMHTSRMASGSVTISTGGLPGTCLVCLRRGGWFAAAYKCMLACFAYYMPQAPSISVSVVDSSTSKSLKATRVHQPPTTQQRIHAAAPTPSRASPGCRP